MQYRRVQDHQTTLPMKIDPVAEAELMLRLASKMSAPELSRTITRIADALRVHDSGCVQALRTLSTEVYCARLASYESTLDVARAALAKADAHA